MSARTPSRILVVLLALWQSLKLAGKHRPDSHPERILVAHHLLLGDTLTLTPLLAKLRQMYPRAEIVMTVPKNIFPLYVNPPYKITAVPYDPRDTETLIALKRVGGFDLAIVPGDNRFSWLALALGSKWIVAFAGDRPAYKSWPVNQSVPYPDRPAAWGDMVAGLIDGAPPLPYQPDVWPQPECAPFDLPASPYCVLHVGARNPLRFWGGEKWLELASHLTKSGFKVVWSGGNHERQHVAMADPQGRYTSFAGRLDLAQLWRLFKHAALLVCPDTGVSHLGRVVGTPTVTLFGPGCTVLSGAGDFWRDSPFVPVTIADFPCRDQKLLFKREISWMKRCVRSVRECNSNLCMQAITLDMARDACDLLLSRYKHK
jgi:ADP-heptose:LPS heptosyltransferase